MTDCNPETLAEGPGCRVDRCHHGCIHLILGALTVPLQAAQFLAFSSIVESAAAELAH